MELLKYQNMYLEHIKKYANSTSELPDHKIYEFLFALELNMIDWDNLPPEFDIKFNIPHTMDYGVDLVDLDYTKACQVKKYEGSHITWSHLSKFKTYASDILEIPNGNIILATTKSSTIDKLSKIKLIDTGKMELLRYDFDELLDKYVDVPLHKVFRQLTVLEERPYLLECYNVIINSGDKEILKCQLPCGCGKTYIMLYTIQKELVNDPSLKFIIYIPWVDLANQTYELYNKFGMKCEFIGNGKTKIKDPDFNILICVNASSSNVDQNLEFKYKFIDEAHHVENDESETYKLMRLIRAEKEIHFSSTFRNNDNLDYVYTLTDAIENGWISDYVVHLMMFTGGNRIDALVGILKDKAEYFPMFVYFNSTQRCKEFSDKLKELGVKADQLDGSSSNTKRRNVKYKLENNDLNILSLCGVYNEGISIDNVRTIVFGDLRHSDINKTQIMMRACRIHESKPFYRIIIPTCDDDFNEKNLGDIISTFGKIDKRFPESIKKKSNTRLKIDITNMNTVNSEDSKMGISAAELLYEQIYDRVGNLIECKSNMEKWLDNLDKVKNYIDENHKRPSHHIGDRNTKALGKWLSHQQTNYNKITDIMRDDIVRSAYKEFSEEYHEYFMDNEEKWNINLNKAKNYINKNQKRPSCHSKIKEIRTLGCWLSNQQIKYEKKTEIMKNDHIRNIYKKFLGEYHEYFMSNEEIWNVNLNKVKKYIEENHKKPSCCDKNKEIKTLGKWLSTQKTKYEKKTEIMKNNHIKKLYEEFLDEYHEYFMSSEEKWNVNLNKVKQYINNNHKKPSPCSNNKEIKMLGNWLSTQRINYSKNIKIMKDDDIRKKYKEFLDEYHDYFMDNGEVWNINLDKVKNYINENRKKPSQYSKNKEIKALGNWLFRQQSIYKKKTEIMKNEKIVNTYKKFLEEYKEYFKNE